MRRKLAQDLEPGDILKSTKQNGVFSIREVLVKEHPTLKVKEVVVRGPLHVTVKYPLSSMVYILN